MWGRIAALLLRYLYLYRRSLARSMEIFFWPVMDLLVWGFVSVYFQRIGAPRAVLFLLGGLIFWDVFYRSQQAITLSLTEEIWVRNLLNVFIAPVRIGEVVFATCLLGLIRALLSTAVLGILALVLYQFDLLLLGPALLPYFASLLLFGWAVGMCTMAVILRFGHAAEALIWGTPFLLQPISAVFYPLSVLPPWLRAIARFLPSTHVFEGMRATLETGRPALGPLVPALALNAVYLLVAGTFFGWMMKRVREKGYLGRLAME
jgi:ABC-2 type transport system permease protein